MRLVFIGQNRPDGGPSFWYGQIDGRAVVAYHPSLNGRTMADEIEYLKRNWAKSKSIMGWSVPLEHASRVILGDVKLWMRHTAQGALIEIRRFDAEDPERREELTGGLVPSKRQVALRWARTVKENHGLAITLMDDEGEPRPDIFTMIVERFSIEFDEEPKPSGELWINEWV